MIPLVLRKQGWTAWHPLGAVLAAAAGVYVTLDAWSDMFTIATVDDEQSHVFLVPIVAAWMVWVRRARLMRCPPGGYIVGPAFLAAGWALGAYGYRNGVESFWHGGAVLVLIGCVLSVLGKYVLFRFLPALLVLAFLVPVPGIVRQELSLKLQYWSASATHAVLQVMGVSSELAGNMVRVKGMDVTVAEACNGMRMVFALVLVTYAFAFGFPLRTYVRVLLLLASPFIALLANVPRLVATSLMYANSSRESADRFHDLSGWVMLPLAFLVLMAIVKILKWALLPVARYTLAYQ